MDSTNEFTSNKTFRTVGIIFLILASLLLLAKTLNAFRGEPISSPDARPQITVSGQGEIAAKPDIAMISYSVIEDGKTPAEAQTKATEKWNKAIEYLKSVGVAEKDIKTTGYFLNPKYDYTQADRICSPGFCPPAGNPVLVGYTITQTAEVKVRDLAKAGDILSGIGGLGVQNVNGLNFTFDDPEKMMAEARQKAIADAKGKAQVLANDLGVRLVRISSFQEGGNSPMYYAREMATNQAKGAMDAVAPAPALPTGENKLFSNVTITYEIR